MTPQEAQLVNDLFDRLAKLESTPRDAAAERLIADGLQRAPHAVYALVQTTLVQDEALKRANARIEELQAQTAGEQAAEERPASFLDTMREALTGHAAARGSVPSVRPRGLESQDSPSRSFQPQGGQQPQPAYPPPAGYSSAAPFGSGGSFLGTAASAAAGVIGGSLLLDGIRSMFGHNVGGYGPASVGGFGADSASPWSSAGERTGANTDPASNVGIDRISEQRSDADTEPGDVEPAADTDDAYNTDDSSDPGDDDFDAGDSGSDSYDV